MQQVYMDYAATSPMLPEVAEAMQPFFSQRFGNPSSIHSMGQGGRDAVETARGQLAALIGCRPMEVVFTGGGTEADNHAIKGVCLAGREKGNHIITTAIEHHAVLYACNFMKTLGFEVTVLPVDKDGLVDPGDIKDAITGRTLLVSVMHANNEVGAIQPIAEISKITREAGVLLHCDAVQTLGHLPVDVDKLGVDLLSGSGHKLYGPKGVGMLYVRPGTRILPLLHGGEQEHGKRAGTENVPGIVGFGEAAVIAARDMSEEAVTLTSYRDRLIEGVLAAVDDARLTMFQSQIRRQRMHARSMHATFFVAGPSSLPPSTAGIPKAVERVA